jgi:hypothetical protein
MSTRSKRAITRIVEAKHSRAALWTIQLAVEAVADSVCQLKALQGRVYRGHKAALWALRMARHHSLQDRDQSFVEHGIGKLAERVDWPATIRLRTRREHLERPLSTWTSSVVVGRLRSPSGTMAASCLVSSLAGSASGDSHTWL